MGAYYQIGPRTKTAILELLRTCNKIDLGNVSFSYYHDQIDFYLSENKFGWDLVVKAQQGRDIYKVVDSEIVYKYSEQD